MNCFVEPFNKSAVSKESAYMHLKKIKQQNKSQLIDKASIKPCGALLTSPPPCTPANLCLLEISSYELLVAEETLNCFSNMEV